MRDPSYSLRVILRGMSQEPPSWLMAGFLLTSSDDKLIVSIGICFIYRNSTVTHAFYPVSRQCSMCPSAKSRIKPYASQTSCSAFPSTIAGSASTKTLTQRVHPGPGFPQACMLPLITTVSPGLSINVSLPSSRIRISLPETTAQRIAVSLFSP